MRDTLAEGAAKRTHQGAGERLLMGTARFVGPGELDVDGRRARAKAVVVATGSRPVVPDFLQALGDSVLTTDTLFDREKLPRSIGITPCWRCRTTTRPWKRCCSPPSRMRYGRSKAFAICDSHA